VAGNNPTESNSTGVIIVDREYLRNQLQATTAQLNLKYVLQGMIQERLKFYAALDYDILASDVVNNILVRGDNSFLNDIKVIRADPNPHMDVPCIAINKINDSETEPFLGDQDGEYVDELNKTHQQDISMWTESIELRIWTHNGDERDYLVPILKYILFEIRGILAQLGVINQTISGGQDEFDPMSYTPKIMYWGSYIYTGTLALLSSSPATDPIEGIQLVGMDKDGKVIENNYGVSFMINKQHNEPEPEEEGGE
jgi:hypothetical protein